MKLDIYRKNNLLIKIFLCSIMVFCLLSPQIKNIISEDNEEDSDQGKHRGHLSVYPVGNQESYSSILYNNHNGLPTSEANDIVETSDGFIWIGSYSGLVRYDGVNFERLDSTKGITSVKCLYVDSKDRLWIGTNSNGVALMEKDDIRLWSRDEGLKSTSIRSIIEDRWGRVYVATTQGLLVFDEELNMSYMDDVRLSDAFVNSLRAGKDGTIAGLTNTGEVFLIWNGAVYRYYSFDNSFVDGLTCILPDPEDSSLFYFETQAGNIYHDKLETGYVNSTPIDIGDLSQIQAFEYIDGKVWLCARNGIGVLAEDGFHQLENIPMDNSIGHVMVDYQGNLWFTSTRQGVMKIVPNRFVDLFERYNLQTRVVNSTCMKDDLLFIASDTGLVVLDENGPISSLPLTKIISSNDIGLDYDDLIEMLDGVRIRSIIKDSNDNLWISTWRKYGLIQYKDGQATVYDIDDGIFSEGVRIAYECKDGSILVGSTGGVTVLKDGKAVAVYGEEQGITNTEILSVCEGMNGDIIIGSDGGGIFIITKNGIKNINHDEGLTSGAVMRVKYDEDHHIFWVVTGDSLAYLNEDYELTNLNNFPYSNNFDVYENSKGELWVLSSNGIYVAKIEDMLKDEKNYPILHYGISDGLSCVATGNSYSELTDEGILYMAGTTSIDKVNIEEPFESFNDIKASVPYVEIDDVKVYPNDEGKFILPSNFDRLEVYGRAFTYSLVEPLITCKLEGLDKTATTGYAKDIFPLHYTNLPGGDYNFVLQLKDSMGNVSKTVNVEIIKEKAFYEQLWFYILAALALIAIITLLTRSYINRKFKALEQKHHEEVEKERIANELSMAGEIQQSMLPHVFPPFPDRKEFEIYAMMDPAKGVGGDFYDFFLVDEDHLCLIMADVSGKGIPGALFMMLSKIIIQSFAKTSDSISKILQMANDTICANNQVQMFVTVWAGILEISTGKLIASNAGHEYPVIKHPNGNFEILKDKHGFVLGGYEGSQYSEYELNLEPGSKLFLYTDGVPEATNSANEMFGTDRLVDALNIDNSRDPQNCIIAVKKAVDDFVKEAEQFDDLTMMCIEYKGKQE